jgi:hypothetical protein
MDIKISFFDIMSEVQKDLEHVSAGIGIFYPMRKHFVWNLLSKLVRSTWTLQVQLGLNLSWDIGSYFGFSLQCYNVTSTHNL